MAILDNYMFRPLRALLLNVLSIEITLRNKAHM